MSYAGPSATGRSSAPHPTGRARPAAGITPRLPVRQPPDRGPRAALFATGVVLGLALGAGVALLFAPQAGDDTRHSLARRGRRLARRGRDAWDDLRDELQRAARRRRLRG
jgi:hypothetical protein